MQTQGLGSTRSPGFGESTRDLERSTRYRTYRTGLTEPDPYEMYSRVRKKIPLIPTIQKKKTSNPLPGLLVFFFIGFFCNFFSDNNYRRSTGGLLVLWYVSMR